MSSFLLGCSFMSYGLLLFTFRHDVIVPADTDSFISSDAHTGATAPDGQQRRFLPLIRIKSFSLREQNSQK